MKYILFLSLFFPAQCSGAVLHDSSSISGCLIHVEKPYGNVRTNINEKLVRKAGLFTGATIYAVINGKTIPMLLVKNSTEAEKRQSFAYINPDSLLSFAVRMGDFPSAHGASQGDRVKINLPEDELADVAGMAGSPRHTRIFFDIRYASASNFTGKKIYSASRCLLRRKAANALFEAAGNAARSGVVAALLAKKGFTAHANILEEHFGFFDVFRSDNPYDLNRVTDGLGKTFELTTSGIAIKLYPSCHDTHACINHVRDLISKHDFSPQDVESIDYVVSELIASVATYTDPKTALEGKFSIEYCIARALHDRAVGLEHFTDEKVNEPKIRETIKKITKHVDPSLYGLAGANVTIRLTDGRQLKQGSTDVMKGFPQLPLTHEELTEKYKGCAQLLLSPEGVDRALELMENLEDLKDTVELMDIVMGSKSS